MRRVCGGYVVAQRGAAPAALVLCLLAGCSSSGSDDAPTAAATAGAPGAGQPAAGQSPVGQSAAGQPGAGQPGAGQPPSAGATDVSPPSPGRPLPFITVPALPAPSRGTAGPSTAPPPAPPPAPPATAAAPPVPSAGSGSTEQTLRLVGFQSPSGNIHCSLASDEADSDMARCDIVEATWSPPPRPADCDLAWGSSVSVGGSGRADFDCAGDTVMDPANPVLRYGQASASGGVRCTSRESGMTCTASATGHGFELSRDAYRLF